MAFSERRDRYMAVESDSGGSSGSFGSGGTTGTGIRVHTGNQVDALIGGPEYFRRIKNEINSLDGSTPGEFIYIAGWWLGEGFSLDSQAGGTPLTDLLISKSRAGVDVRVLGWVMAPEVLQNSMVQSTPDAASMLSVNGGTMRFIEALRAESSLADKAVLNILAHPAGAVHAKMAIVGNENQATGYTGGIDFESFRHDPDWHDVQAAVQGPAVQAIFECFRTMWNEVRSRSPVAGLSIPASMTLPNGRTISLPGVTCDSHTTSMPHLPSRTLARTSSGRMHVQSARTLPNFSFSSMGSVASLAGYGLPTNESLSYAPSGLFEIKEVWQKGFQGARTYIYGEDQAFWSREIFDWINAAVKANSELRVVLLTGQWDPNDQPNASANKFFRIAVNNHLLSGLGSSDIDRIGLFSHRRRTVHTKTAIVDDEWALIGSANYMRRSLYTDFEHTVSYMDEQGVGVPRYREALWGEHLRSSIPDPQDGLDAWFALPFQGSGAAAPLEIERIRLPLPSASLTQQEQVLYDEIFDADSRQTWGGQLIQHFVSEFGAGMLSQ